MFLPLFAELGRGTVGRGQHFESDLLEAFHIREYFLLGNCSGQGVGQGRTGKEWDDLMGRGRARVQGCGGMGTGQGVGRGEAGRGGAGRKGAGAGREGEGARGRGAVLSASVCGVCGDARGARVRGVCDCSEGPGRYGRGLVRGARDRV